MRNLGAAKLDEVFQVSQKTAMKVLSGAQSLESTPGSLVNGYASKLIPMVIDRI